MTSKIHYSNAPADMERALQEAVATDDFLPSPHELVRKVAKERITIALDKHSLDLFKQYAKKHNAPYQTMMNKVLGSYADKYLSR